LYSQRIWGLTFEFFYQDAQAAFDQLNTLFAEQVQHIATYTAADCSTHCNTLQKLDIHVAE